jgi:hypothetical protein
MLGPLAALALTAVTVVPDQRYAAGWLYRFFFGSQWRDAWTAPIDAPVLDLDTFDGGLVPTRKGGGLETTNLHFKSKNGRSWVWRSMDKDPTRVLDPDTRNSVIGDIYQDLTSTAHPCGAVVVAPLMDALGLVHATPRIAILPDDARLAPFGKLGGVLGFIEERMEMEEAGGDEEIETAQLFLRLQRRGEERVDAREYLRARLLDILVGDWDRHVDQWRWVHVRRDGVGVWRPVPRDRDQAFSRFDPIVPAVAEYYTKQLASFRDGYPAIEKLTYSGRFTDRRFLVPLDKSQWEAETSDVVARITDAVISGAVQRLPPAMARQSGGELQRALRARRDALAEASRDFFRLLADQVDVHAPEDTEPVEVKKVAAGVEVSIRRRDETIFRRTFVPGETSEIRIYAPGGERGVVVDPAARDAITVRVAAPRAIAVELGTRDWGHDLLFFPLFSYDGSRGFVPGVHAHLTRYGFEMSPFASGMDFVAAFSTTALRPRLEYGADVRTRSPLRFLAFVAYSGMDGGDFHGIGNETANTVATPGFYHLRQERVLGEGTVEVPLFGPLRGRAGMFVESVYTPREKVIALLQPYGAGQFTLAGGEMGLAVDTRTGVLTAQRGFKLLANVRYAPGILDNQEGFTKFRGEASVYAGARIVTDVLLDLRVAGERNWGRYPYFESAFIGGVELRSALDVNALFGGGLLRGYDLNRYAGDSSLVGNSELRVALGKTVFLLPLRYGVLGIADAGRVFVAGESSSRVHTGVGGGLWLALFATAPGAQIVTAMNATLFRSETGTSFYFAAGFGL